MATFVQMKDYVSTRLIDSNNEAVSAATVGQAINDSIAYWKFRRFWFNEAAYSANFTVQDATIPLPNMFLVPVTDTGGFFVSYSNIRYPLTKISDTEYDQLYLDNGYGLPRVYARVGGAYEAYPIPDQAYSCHTRYLKDYNDLSADSDTNDFTDNADRLINLWALANLSAELRQDDKMEAYYRAAAEAEYRNLSVMTDKSNGTGRLSLGSSII